jgi:hypothetical protein
MNPVNQIRSIKLRKWLQLCLNGPFTIQKIIDDASSRRFFRIICNNRRYIAIDSPNEYNKNDAFLHLNLVFKKINTPDIYSVDSKNGFFLEEDFGTKSVFSDINTGTKFFDIQLYKKVIRYLVKFQKLSKKDVLPEYSEQIVMLEMNHFKEWYREKYLAKPFNTKENYIWNKITYLLQDNFSKQDKVFVHRDYHSKNIMTLPNRKLGIIDYQDALYGPASYDLVSILRDVYVHLSDVQINKLIIYYLKISGKKTQITEFTRAFDLTGIQRQLKILGLFARLSIRDGKNNYLTYIPTIKNCIFKTTDQYSQLSDLRYLIEP